MVDVFIFSTIAALIGASVVTLFHLWRYLGDVLDKKALQPIWLQLLLVVLFIGGIIGGFALARGFTDTPRGGNYLVPYIAGMVVGYLVAGVLFIVAMVLPDYRGASTLGKYDFEMSRKSRRGDPDAEPEGEEARDRRRRKYEEKQRQRIREEEEERQRQERKRQRLEEEDRQRRERARERRKQGDRLEEVEDDRPRRRDDDEDDDRRRPRR
jgi:hypothetical protein